MCHRLDTTYISDRDDCIRSLHMLTDLLKDLRHCYLSDDLFGMIYDFHRLVQSGTISSRHPTDSVSELPATPSQKVISRREHDSLSLPKCLQTIKHNLNKTSTKDFLLTSFRKEGWWIGGSSGSGKSGSGAIWLP